MKNSFNETKNNRAVIYCRVSSEKQLNGESLAGQERECRIFAQNNGLEVIEVFVEKGESGRDMDRTQIKKLIDFIEDKSNNISSIIVWKLDRFSRNICDTVIFERLAKKLGVKLLSTRESNDSTPEGNLRRNIASVMAQYETEVNTTRTLNGLKSTIAAGRWTSKLRGYNFAKNPEGKQQLYPNKEAQYIKKIFELISQGTYSQREVIRKMENDYGYKINKQTLANLLRIPVYCGLLPDKYKTNNGEYIKGIHEPLISEELFFKVQAILDGKRPAIVEKKRNNPMFPLRQYIYCEKCGKMLTASSSRGKSGSLFYYYHCSKNGCERYKKDIVENAYENYLNTIKPAESVLKLFEKKIISRFNISSKDRQNYKNTLKKDIEKLKKTKDNTVSSFVTTENTNMKQELERKLDEITAEIALKESLLKESEEKNTVDIKDCWTFVKYFLNNMGSIWKSMDLTIKQKIQCLITPKGFTFKENLIEPLKSIDFSMLFRDVEALCLAKGG